MAAIVAIVSSKARPALAPHAAPESTAAEDAARDAQGRIDAAIAHVAKLEAERDAYAIERRESFWDDVRALLDPRGRGSQVVDLVIVTPCASLPPGVTLLDTSDAAGAAEADGSLIVGSSESPEVTHSERRPITPRALAIEASPDEIRRRLELLRSEAPLVAGARAVSLARECIGGAFDRGARAEAVCHERIAALEGQRLTDPAEFRARSMTRMRRAVDEGAREVRRAAVARLDPSFAPIRAEWRALVASCTDRKSVEACLRSIKDSAPERLASIADGTNDFVLQELQRVSDTMQIWLLEEIHARYQLARRASIGQAGAPVIADVSDLASLDTGALQGALDTFEQGRVGIGLGGAAAGAVIGTLIAPVIGTAIGAFLGVLAGFLKGIESLREDCATKVSACLDDAALAMRAQLDAREASFASALEASLEDALDAAMQRFERSIARLMDLETRTLAAERAKLAELATLRASLEAEEARLAALARRALACAG
jgi:hypothetical protein